MESTQITYLQKFQEKFGILFDAIPKYYHPNAWILLLVLLSATLSIFTYQKKKQVKFQRIPGPKVNGFIATLIPLINILRNKTASPGLLVLQILCGYSRVFQKEGLWMWFFWGSAKPMLTLYKAETVEPVLNSKEILSKGLEYYLLKNWLKEGLITSKGSKWRCRRKLLTPAFHFRTLDEFVPVFNEQANILAGKILKAMETSESIDITPLTSLCMLDIICETAMGKKINAQENDTNPYVLAVRANCESFIERIMRPWLWPEFVYYKTKRGKEYKKNLEIMDKFIRQVVNERKQEKISISEGGLTNSGNGNSKCKLDVETDHKDRKRLALLDLLWNVHFNDPSFTFEDIAEEVDNFMFAGHDTTSSSLNWVLYMLGLNPEIQNEVHHELDDILGHDVNREITIDDIKKLKYVECVLKETRRLFPPTPFISRELEEDTLIGGYTIPKGANCGIFIYMLHRDPDVFPNPEVFDPDRFKLSNAAGRHPYAYVPFSAGPRNCIGQRFANIEVVIVLATILRRFKVKSLLPLDKLFITNELITRSENGLHMNFQPRGSFKNM